MFAVTESCQVCMDAQNKVEASKAHTHTPPAHTDSNRRPVPDQEMSSGGSHPLLLENRPPDVVMWQGRSLLPYENSTKAEPDIPALSSCPGWPSEPCRGGRNPPCRQAAAPRASRRVYLPSR
jgi:hypothetical protein